MLLTGDLISAQQAEQYGLVDQLLPADQLDAAVDDLARRIAANAPIAAQLAKHLVRVSQSTAVDIGLQYENDAFAYCFTTQDSQEGRSAFAEKRKPNFKGQ
jgi:enoyl-CoA hydratase/carnithine racemase